jgi:hypothetical protein
MLHNVSLYWILSNSQHKSCNEICQHKYDVLQISGKWNVYQPKALLKKFI